MELEWDEAKRLRVLEDRGIDFERAKEIWQGTVLEVPSRKEWNEERFLAIGEVDGRVDHGGLHLARREEAADHCTTGTAP